MAKHRRAAKVDANQPAIVDALRRVPGVSVEVEHDDIFVGYKGRNYWYEIKTEDCRSKMTGACNYGDMKPSQRRLLKTWRGHYKIVFNVEEILADMGITDDDLRKSTVLTQWGFSDGEIG